MRLKFSARILSPEIIIPGKEKQIQVIFRSGNFLVSGIFCVFGFRWKLKLKYTVLNSLFSRILYV